MSAALFWTAAKKRRRYPPLKTETANLENSAVRLENLVAQHSLGRTISLILPNNVHGCKKLNLGRSS
jgi:hypothetical protein